MVRIMFLLLLVATTVSAQFDCDIIVNYDNVSQVRDRLVTFEQDLENYINSNTWSSADMGGEKIKCTFTIFFVGATGDNSYQAQAFIGSSRSVYAGSAPSDRKSPVVRLFDDKWEFTYVKGQTLQRNDSQFDPLTDFLDFYLYLILGFDFDSFEKQGGTQYFQRAYTLLNQAPSSSKGWDRGSATAYSKFSLIEEINNPKYQPFREGFYQYHYRGLDLLATKPEAAFRNMASLIEKIAELKKTSNPKSILFRTFFEAKYEELAEVFKRYPDTSLLQLLTAVDPAHLNAYDQAMRSR